jgi:cyclohexadienyl dehydratase
VRRLLPWLVALLVGCAGAEAPRPVLRVGTSGDYAPFSLTGTAGRSGFDVEVARAYARDRGLRIRWVPVRWPALDGDFAAARFDVVMSGVTVRPERSLAGSFSVPVTRSGVVLLRSGRVEEPRRIAVNAGGHLERAARRLFPGAELRPLSPNAAVRAALVAGEVDAAVTDTLEAPGWLAGTRGIQALGPYTRDWKAYWLPAAATERARDLDAWLLAREADGTLAALRERTLPEGARVETATPLVALGAALEERLALMPLVAEAKRAAGVPVRAPEQERAVLAVALASVRDAAARAGRAAPSDAAVEGFFGALMDAARDVQARVLAGSAGEDPPRDLDVSLRPAIARVSERIAWLVVRLPGDFDDRELAEILAPLGQLGVTRETRARIARTLRTVVESVPGSPDGIGARVQRDIGHHAVPRRVARMAGILYRE